MCRITIFVGDNQPYEWQQLYCSVIGCRWSYYLLECRPNLCESAREELWVDKRVAQKVRWPGRSSASDVLPDQ